MQTFDINQMLMYNCDIYVLEIAYCVENDLHNWYIKRKSSDFSIKSFMGVPLYSCILANIGQSYNLCSFVSYILPYEYI
jgi:hypothetical protein